MAASRSRMPSMQARARTGLRHDAGAVLVVRLDCGIAETGNCVKIQVLAKVK